MTSNLVLEAISALRAGDKNRARKLLVKAIKKNDKDDDAWLVLSAVVPEKERKIECLERAIKINPNNKKAKQALAKFKPPPPKKLPNKKLMVGGSCGVIAIFMFCAFGLILNGLDNSESSPTSTPAPISAVLSPTSDATKTPTFEPPTLTPTVIQATSTSSPTETLVKPSGFSCIHSSLPITGEVIEVVDGDTIHVLIGGQDFSVRYIGVDSPEMGDSLSQEAFQFNYSLVFGKSVSLYADVSETDRYGRLLHYVFVGDTFVNYEMVLNGYAVAKDYPPDIACSDIFHQAQATAEASLAGFWYPTPVDNRLDIIDISTATPGSSSPPIAFCTCQPPDLDCADFSTHNQAQACYDYCVSLGKGNYYRLDGNDNDGLACEALP